MPRRLAAASTFLALAVLVSACSSNPVMPGDAPSPPPSAAPPVSAGPVFPTCAQVTLTLEQLLGDLAFNQEASLAQTAPEDYEQQVCVYTSTDTATQIGVTIAAIPFQQAEIDNYATLPNAIADERLAEHSAVIQTLAPNDTDDGALDSALYLFDTSYSITIQGLSTAAPIPVSLPRLTVAAAIDAAFAIRALVN